MSGIRRGARVNIHRTYVEIQVPIPAGHVNIGQWQVILWLDNWRLARGAYPRAWRDLPPVEGVTAPIFHWWALGPIHVRRFRWREG